MAKARTAKKTRPKRDEPGEHRITMATVVDCFDECESAMRWYHDLEDKLHFPFLTRYVLERALSPLCFGDEETAQAVEDWHDWVEMEYEF